MFGRKNLTSKVPLNASYISTIKRRNNLALLDNAVAPHYFKTGREM